MYRTKNGEFLLFSCLSSRIFRRSDDFFVIPLENSWRSFCAVGVTADVSIVFGISTISDIPAVAGLFSIVHVDISEVPNFSAAVANVLVVSSC
jgi:hypothetical protein